MDDRKRELFLSLCDIIAFISNICSLANAFPISNSLHFYPLSCTYAELFAS